MADCKIKRLIHFFYRSDFLFCNELSKAEKTRERIIVAAFNEMHEHGYQGMRIENILKETHLAKGALYYYFPSKKKLGYAVVDEILFERLKQQLSLLDSADDPMQIMCELMNTCCDSISSEDISLGCPLNNLIQEMTSLDEGFQKRLLGIFTYWQESIARALEKGKQQGQIKPDVNSDIVAAFIISSMQGCKGTAKNMQSQDMLRNLLGTLCQYIDSLRIV